MPLIKSIRGLLLALGLGSILTSPGVGEACTIPVFRYALDRWNPDPYVLEVPFQLALKPEVDRVLRSLRASTAANLKIEPVEKGSGLVLHSPWKQTWEAEATSSAEFADQLTAWVDSPVRRELATRILKGDSVVWVLVGTGETAQDAATADWVNQRLNYLQRVAFLPPQDPTDPSSQLGPGPALKLSFSLLKTSRQEPAESALLDQLLGKRLEEFRKDQRPWLAAVFGRGRVLGAWPAEELDRDGVDEACLFLLGACSCQVKEQNPGWDLLLAVDWESRLKEAAAEPVVASPEAPPSSQEPPSLQPVEIVTYEGGGAPGKADAEVPAEMSTEAHRTNQWAMALLGSAFLLFCCMGWKTGKGRSS